MSAADYQYTQKMERLYVDRTEELKEFFCREDFEKAYRDYLSAPKDSKKFRLRDLKNVCSLFGMDVDDILSGKIRIEDMPTRAEQETRLMDTFYGLVRSCPTPGAYMERIVRRLKPGTEGEPLRLTILKEYVRAGSATLSTGAAENWVKKRMTEAEQAEFRALPPAERPAALAERLDDSIFTENLGVKADAVKRLDFLRRFALRPAAGNWGEDIESVLTPGVRTALRKYGDGQRPYWNEMQQTLGRIAGWTVEHMTEEETSAYAAAGAARPGVILRAARRLNPGAFEGDSPVDGESPLDVLARNAENCRKLCLKNDYAALTQEFITAAEEECAAAGTEVPAAAAKLAKGQTLGKIAACVLENLPEAEFRRWEGLTAAEKLRTVLAMQEPSIFPDAEQAGSVCGCLRFLADRVKKCRKADRTDCAAVIGPEAWTEIGTYCRRKLPVWDWEQVREPLSGAAAYAVRQMTGAGVTAAYAAYKRATGAEKLRSILTLQGVPAPDELPPVPDGTDAAIWEQAILTVQLLEHLEDCEIVPGSCPIPFPGIVFDQETREKILALCPADTEAEDGADLLECLLQNSGSADPEALSELAETLMAAFPGFLANAYYPKEDGSGLRKATDKLKEAKKDAFDNRLQKLLRECADLAEGSFRPFGNTREKLYQFALVFDLRLRLPESDPVEPERDMARLLFQEYYSDNLTRFLSDAYRDPERPRYASGFEGAPRGDGINFKNFAEVCYLYYIYRRDLKLSPGKRIDAAAKRISECVKAAGTETYREVQEALRHTPEYPFTALYQEDFLTRIVELPEKELVDHILKHYEVPANAAGTAVFQAGAEELTAKQYLDDTLEKVEHYYNGSAGFLDVGLEDRGTGGWKQDWPLLTRLREAHPDDEGFLLLLNNLQARLNEEIKWMGSNEMLLLCYLLRSLLRSSEKPQSLQMLQEDLEKQSLPADAGRIRKGLQTLEQLGFDIRDRTDDTASQTQRFWLGSRKYHDEARDAVIAKTSGAWYDRTKREREAREQMETLIRDRLPEKAQVGRTRLMIVLTAGFIADLTTEFSLSSFEALYCEYALYVEKALEDSRYQPFTLKNPLDLFLLLSVYYYAVENGIEQDTTDE